MIQVYQLGNLTKQWRCFLKNPLSRVITDFILSSPQIILRDLKAYFADRPDFIKTLEQGIELGVIQRIERRYFVNLSNDFKISDIVKTKLTNLRKQFSFLPLTIFAANIFTKIDQKIPPLITNHPLNQELSWIKMKSFDQLITYYFVDRPFDSSFSWPKYFAHLDQEVKLTTEEQEVFALIGDIDPNYAFKQFNLILLKLREQKIIKMDKYDIFIQALVKTKWLNDLGGNSYNSNVKFKEYKNAQRKLLEVNKLQKIFQEQFNYCDYWGIVGELSNWIRKAKLATEVYLISD